MPFGEVMEKGKFWLQINVAECMAWVIGLYHFISIPIFISLPLSLSLSVTNDCINSIINFIQSTNSDLSGK